MGRVGLLDKFLFQPRTVPSVALLIGLLIVKVGVWPMPNMPSYRALAENPFINPFTDPSAHYLVWNWLGPYLAWRTGFETSSGFFALHLTFTVLLLATFVAWALRRFDARTARTAIALFCILPPLATALFWVGMDSLTLFLMLMMLIARRRLALAVPFGVLLGLQHSEQGAAAFGTLLVATLIGRERARSLGCPPSFAALMLLAVVAGKALLVLVFRHYGIEVNSGRLFWLTHNLPDLLTYFAMKTQLIVWSILGVGWLVAIKFMRRDRTALWTLAVPLAMVIALSALVADETRVCAIVVFPTLFVFVLSDADFLASLAADLPPLVLVWLLVPFVWSWGGTPLWSVFPHDVAYGLHAAFGLFDAPSAPLTLWPFR